MSSWRQMSTAWDRATREPSRDLSRRPRRWWEFWQHRPCRPIRRVDQQACHRCRYRRAHGPVHIARGAV